MISDSWAETVLKMVPVFKVGGTVNAIDVNVTADPVFVMKDLMHWPVSISFLIIEWSIQPMPALNMIGLTHSLRLLPTNWPNDLVKPAMRGSPNLLP